MPRQTMSRRQALAALGALGAAAAGGLASPRTASAAGLGRHETVEAALARLFGGRPMKDGSGIITLELPAIAENGAVVPIGIEVNAPMTSARYVKHIYVIADRNRIPVVLRAGFTPEAGHAGLAANIRLGETGDVRAIVEQSDGSLLVVTRAVQVTVGGCGG